MASAQQLIGLIKSHAEGNEDRFIDLAMQLAAAEEQKGHKRLAEQLRASGPRQAELHLAGVQPTPLAAPGRPRRLSRSYPSTRLADVIAATSEDCPYRH